MSRRVIRALALAALLAAGRAAAAAETDAGCELFLWNVVAERALFSGPGQAVDAGRAGEGAPMIATGRLFALALPAQAEVRYARPPGKTRLANGAHGGLVRVTVPADGDYRIALSSAHWVDVIDGDRALRSADFHGASGCDAPRKLVRYRLPGGRPLLIQLSGAVDAVVRLSVTPEP